MFVCSVALVSASLTRACVRVMRLRMCDQPEWLSVGLSTNIRFSRILSPSSCDCGRPCRETVLDISHTVHYTCLARERHLTESDDRRSPRGAPVLGIYVGVTAVTADLDLDEARFPLQITTDIHSLSAVRGAPVRRTPGAIPIVLPRYR